MLSVVFCAMWPKHNTEKKKKKPEWVHCYGKCMTIWPVCIANTGRHNEQESNFLRLISKNVCSQNSHNWFFNICVCVGGAFPRSDHLRTHVVFGVARENWTHPFNLIWALNINLLIHQMLRKSIDFLFDKQTLYKDSHFITGQNSSILFIYDHMCICNHASHYLHSCTEMTTLKVSWWSASDNTRPATKTQKPLSLTHQLNQELTGLVQRKNTCMPSGRVGSWDVCLQSDMKCNFQMFI